TTPLLQEGDGMSPSGARSPSSRPADLPNADIVLVSLGRGADHAESIGALAEQLGLSRRDVEKALQQIACEGIHPLVADGSGVYLATSPSEIDGYLASLR